MCPRTNVALTFSNNQGFNFRCLSMNVDAPKKPTTSSVPSSPRRVYFTSLSKGRRYLCVRDDLNFNLKSTPLVTGSAGKKKKRKTELVLIKNVWNMIENNKSRVANVSLSLRLRRLTFRVQYFEPELITAKNLTAIKVHRNPFNY